MNWQTLTLNKHQAMPIYLQIYQWYCKAIISGELLPGSRVPAIRTLASERHLAKRTIEQAYDLLISEGYLETKGSAGTFVSSKLKTFSTIAQKPSAHLSTKTTAAPDSTISAFQLGLPALDAFPQKTWQRLMTHHLRTQNVNAMIYSPSTGYTPLRQSIATYLGLSRGIACSYEQVFITTGYRGGLSLICQALLHKEKTGWYEEPGYHIARDYLLSRGLQLTAIPIDKEGLHVQDQYADFAVVTPTHQSPTGVAMTLPRRLALLAWANRHQSWIIEDDYDSEFHYQGRPLPALKSLDKQECVLYCGTFSKVLYPGLNLGYVVIPERLITTFENAAKLLPNPAPFLIQATTADFMKEGHFVRHLRKMRLLYAERRQYLIDAILQIMGDQVYIQPQAGGLHIVAYFKHQQNDLDIALKANAQGLAVQALSQWHMKPTNQRGLIMSFTNIKTKEEAMSLAHQLQKTIA